MNKKGLYWHVHHNILVEWCYDYKERVEAIKGYKPQNEIETRLRLLKPVKGRLPKDLVEAWQKYVEAWRKYVEADQKCDEAYQKRVEAYQKYDEARQKCDEALLKHKPLLEKLHAKECGCKEWNGKEIVFGGEK